MRKRFYPTKEWAEFKYSKRAREQLLAALEGHNCKSPHQVIDDAESSIQNLWTQSRLEQKNIQEDLSSLHLHLSKIYKILDSNSELNSWLEASRKAEVAETKRKLKEARIRGAQAVELRFDELLECLSLYLAKFGFVSELSKHPKFRGTQTRRGKPAQESLYKFIQMLHYSFRQHAIPIAIRKNEALNIFIDVTCEELKVSPPANPYQTYREALETLRY